MRRLFLSVVGVSCMCNYSVESFTYEPRNCADYNQYDTCNDILVSPLRKAGLDAYFSFSASLDETYTNISQDIKTDMDESVFSAQNKFMFKYLFITSGYSYGADVKVKCYSGIIKQGNAMLDTAYAFVELPKIGELSVGYNDDAACMFAIDSSAVLTGYQGPASGNFEAFFNKASATIIGTGFPFDDGRAAQIMWLSPQIKGIRLGLSYTPDSRYATLCKRKHEHSSEVQSQDQCGSPFIKNLWSFGASYSRGASETLKMDIAFAYWMGNSRSNAYCVQHCGADQCHHQPVKLHDTRGYNIGLLLQHKDLQFACSFTDNCKTFLPTHMAKDSTENGLLPGCDAGKSYTAGLAYNIKSLALYCGYFYSVVKMSDKSGEKATADIYTVGAEYGFSKHFSSYVEYNKIDTRTCERAIKFHDSHGNNSGNMICIGIKVKF